VTPLVLSAFVLIIIFILVFVKQPPVPPPWEITGCYSTTGAPDIFVNKVQLHVLQAEPLDVPYVLENHKGWDLTLGTWLNFRTLPDGRGQIVQTSNSGEFLFLSKNGEVTTSVPGFDIYVEGNNAAIRYKRVGSTCTGGAPLTPR